MRKELYTPLFLPLLAVLLFFAPSLRGQEIGFDVSLVTDWVKAELNAGISYNLAQAGVRLPTGRFMAEEILIDAYPRLIRPHLMSVRVDSSSTIANLVERGELSLEELDNFCRNIERMSVSLSSDLAQMTGRYKVYLEKLSALLLRHRRAIEPERPLFPALAADYTGIIIIADEELPVHGRRSRSLLEPCLFPKVWDSDMNLVYERNMFDSSAGALMVRYAAGESVFHPTPSGLDGELAAFLGPNPLRILAAELFGVNTTDPVIDRDDALKILSTENNRRLLREGRVLFVLNENKLH